MSKFQLTLLISFGAFIVLAVILFSFYKGSSKSASHLTVWGPMPASQFAELVSEAKLNTKTVTFTYVEKSESTLDADFTEALATGQGPDLIILPQSLVYKEHAKLLEIPYSSVSQGDYQNAFIGAGDIFTDAGGIWALPFEVDPLVLYWNKTILSSAGIAEPMRYWDEIYDASAKLTVKDAAGNITQSTIALGETKNIPHASDILALLMLQAGTPITTSDGLGLHSAIGSSENLPVNPAGAALDFYTQFSDPLKPYYSWNKSLLPAQSSFAVGDSAYYVGYASELASFRAKSPTLPLAVAPVPQSRTSGAALTYAKLYGVAISRQTADPSGALAGALSLISSTAQSSLSGITGLPPVRRDLLSAKQSDGTTQAFYTAAIQAKGFIDPDGARSSQILTDMIDSVTSGRSRTSEAVLEADSSLQALIDNGK